MDLQVVEFKNGNFLDNTAGIENCLLIPALN